MAGGVGTPSGGHEPPAASADGFVTLEPEAAQLLAHRALVAGGASEATAACVAFQVVEAELAGHPSHGLRLIPGYCERAGADGCRLDAEPEVIEQPRGLSLVDAHGGLGYRALELAVDAAAATARDSGLGACGVIRCGHAGRAGGWVERGVEQGMVTIVLLGGSDPPFVLAAGPGAVASLHTNPIAIGVPADGPPLVLDMATSLVAEGKVGIARSRGTGLPEGAILDAGGTPTNDPDAFYDGGALLPAAGHKGFGLSAMIEVLSVLVTGADATGLRPAEGALVICLDAGGFRPAADVREAVEALRERLHDSGLERQVLAPGEPEAASRASRAVWVEAAVHADLVARSSDVTG